MPKRTNTFQKVVTILHSHMAGEASVVESEMLVNRVTGEKREVDVVIRSVVAGQEMILGIEATMKKGSSPWVEQMIGKHVDLPTDRLVLVAEKGFSRPARRYAAQKGVALIAPEDFTKADPALKLVSRIQRMWPKGVAMTPEALKIVVRKPDGALVRVRDVPPDGLLYFGDETVAETHWGLFKFLFENQFPRFAEMLDLANVEEDRDEEFYLQVGHPDAALELLRHGMAEPLYLRWELSDPPELHQALAMEYHGRLVINVADVELTHKRFAASNVSYGEASIAGREALFVFTEDEQGVRMTIQHEKPEFQGEQPPSAAAEGYAADDMGEAGEPAASQGV